MRIVCGTIGDFVENLKGNKVFDETVWVDRTDREENEAKTGVTLQASAVLEIGEGEALLQYGQDCGLDYMDGEMEKEGTFVLNRRMGILDAYCEKAGLKIKPGLVDM